MPRCCGRAPVEVDRVGVGRDHEQVGVEVLREHRRAAVLVDDRLHAHEGAGVAVVGEVELLLRQVHRRDASAAGADHDRARLEQLLDRPDLEDALGQRRGHHAAPVLAVLLDRPALLGREPPRDVLGVDRPDELRGVLHRRVVGVDLGHREDRGDRLLERHHVAELLLDQVADHPLGLRAEDVEGVRRLLVVRRRLQREQPDLRVRCRARSPARARRRPGSGPGRPDARSPAGSPPSSARRASAVRCLPEPPRHACRHLPDR